MMQFSTNYKASRTDVLFYFSSQQCMLINLMETNGFRGQQRNSMVTELGI